MQARQLECWPVGRRGEGRAHSLWVQEEAKRGEGGPVCRTESSQLLLSALRALARPLTVAQLQGLRLHELALGPGGQGGVQAGASAEQAVAVRCTGHPAHAFALAKAGGDTSTH